MSTSPPNVALQPGSTGSAVQQLQDYLVSVGLMTQAQVNTGYGTYGPQTTAAVQALQQKLGVNNSSGPGYYGPQTIAAVTSSGSQNASGGFQDTPANPNGGYTAPPVSSPQIGPSSPSALSTAGLIPTPVTGGSSNSGSSSSSTSSWVQPGIVQVNGSYFERSTDGTLVPQTDPTILQGIQNGQVPVLPSTPTDHLASSASTSTSSTGNGTSGNGITTTSTGNSTLDSVLTGITGVANGLISSGYTIPADLQITPAVVQQFLTYAHANVDPYYKQQLDGEIADVNANLANMQTQYESSAGQAVNAFGTQLASQDNTAGGNGVAMSGQRQLTDNNLVNNTNLSLGALGSQAAYNAGQALRTGAADVGVANAGGFNLPNLYPDTVSLGGQRGTINTGTSSPLSLNYDPSIYTVGTIPSNQAAAATALQQTYLTNYGNLAGAQSNSGRSMSDLMNSVVGLT